MGRYVEVQLDQGEGEEKVDQSRRGKGVCNPVKRAGRLGQRTKLGHWIGLIVNGREIVRWKSLAVRADGVFWDL